MNAEPPEVPSGFALREATAADLDALAALEAASFGDEAWSREQLAGGLAAAGALWLVAVPRGEGGAVEAYAAFQRAEDEAELQRVAVAPAVRRRGLGTALVATGFERLHEEGVRTCFLEVAADNRAARELYERLGFRTVGRRPGYYPRGSDALLLRADLGVCPVPGQVLS